MLVSVIIPCFNVEDFVEECLESVYFQTHPYLEVICVDNNSTDNTLRILNKLKSNKYKNLIIGVQKKKGASAARNFGLSISTGDWIQFLDADDLLLPKKIEHQLNLIKQNTCFVVANSVKRKVNWREEVCNYDNNKFIGLLQTKLGNTCANLWNKKMLNKIGGWDEELFSSQEYNLMFSLLKQNDDIVFDGLSLTIIRERESGQISQSDPEKKWKSYLDLRLRIISYLQTEKIEYYEKNKDLIQQILFDILRVYSKYNLKHANKVYKKELLGFVPKITPTTSEKYIKLFKIFGFMTTEKIKRIL